MSKFADSRSGARRRRRPWAVPRASAKWFFGLGRARGLYPRGGVSVRPCAVNALVSGVRQGIVLQTGGNADAMPQVGGTFVTCDGNGQMRTGLASLLASHPTQIPATGPTRITLDETDNALVRRSSARSFPRPLTVRRMSRARHVGQLTGLLANAWPG